jgi:hypothetical protein
MPFTHYLQGNGDINGDNFVEDQDYSLLGLAWYSQAGDSNFNVNADFNGDGFVEDQDYSILGNNWYLEGLQCFGSDGNAYQTDAMSVGLIGTPGNACYSLTVGGTYSWLNGTIALANYTGGVYGTIAEAATVYLQAYREGSGDRYFYTSTQDTTVAFTRNFSDTAAVSGVGYARFSMQVPQPGEYTVWAKVSHWLAGTASVSAVAAQGSYRVYYVSTAGSDGNNGLSWAAPWQHVQYAVSMVGTRGGGDVWVRKGAYSEFLATTNLYDQLPGTCLYDGVALYGGFSGVESAKSQRPTCLNSVGFADATVLSPASGKSRPVLYVTGNGFSGSLTQGLVLDGLTITGGTPDAHAVGGGVLYGSVPGDYAKPCAPLTVTGSQFIGNTAYLGGGMACIGDGANSRVIVHGCLFEYNIGLQPASTGYASGEGGALYCANCPYLSFTDNVVYCNTGGRAGGGVSVRDCGLAAGQGLNRSAPDDSSVRVANNVFAQNLVEFPSGYGLPNQPYYNGGAAVSLFTSTYSLIPPFPLTNATVANNTFAYNVCNTINGGSWAVGGGAIRSTNGLCTCTNNLFDCDYAAVGNSVSYTGTTGSVNIGYCDAYNYPGQPTSLPSYFTYHYSLCNVDQSTTMNTLGSDLGLVNSGGCPLMYRLKDPTSPPYQRGSSAYVLPGDQSLDWSASNNDYCFYTLGGTRSVNMGCYQCTAN